MKSAKSKKQYAFKIMKEYLWSEPKVEEIKGKIPVLDLKKLGGRRSSIFNMDDVDCSEFATFISTKKT
mgnify:CR=1 FL=1